MSSRKITSLIPSQTGKCVSHSLPTDMSINRLLLKCCWAFLQNRYKVSLLVRILLASHHGVFLRAWSLCRLSGGILFVLGTNRLWRLKACPPLSFKGLFYGSQVAYLSETFPGETGNCKGCFYDVSHSDFSKTSSRQVQGLMFQSHKLLVWWKRLGMHS